MNINPKMVESWLRHLKGNAALAMLVPAVLEALKVIKPANFTYGINKDTAVLLLVAVAIATVTIAYQVITNKRPEFKTVAGAVEQNVIKNLETVAAQTVAASPDPATISWGVPGAGVVGAQAPPA